MNTPQSNGTITGSEQELFRQSFREEAAEILVEVEAALLALNDCPSDAALVDRVFRALHTIKGSGAMFGFEELASFTHELESAFDEVRKGRLDVTPELVDLTLAALDQIRNFLHPGPEPAAGEEILSRLRSCTRTAASREESVTVTDLSQPPGSGDDEQDWQIDFAPGPDMLRHGSDPLLLLKELAGLGQMTVRARMDGIPRLAELDPLCCYISWTVNLRTRAGEDSIRDVFIFVQDQCELRVERKAAGPAASVPAVRRSQPAEADAAGQALKQERSAQGGRRAYDKADTASSVRVPAAKLDQLVDLVGELVTVQARLSEIAARGEDADVCSVSEQVERLTVALRENSMNMRMVPIRGTFERFRRLVHDLARDLGKNVELTIEGADTELDKTVIEGLSDPLMHLIRNSMDHGIEPPDVRQAQGKSPTARIHLAARHAGASVLISVSDDGRGIDREAVRRRAGERGLTSDDASLSDAQVFDFIFQPGFSTAREVSDLSGRGVGMDVVRRHVDRLRGSIEVASRPNEGTTVTMRLPLTLAIIDGLLVTIAGAPFVLPLVNALECIELTSATGEREGRHVVNVRGEIVPYIRLRDHFDVQSERPAIEQIMLVETDEGRFGLVVDQVLGNCQTVIKSLGRCYRGIQTVSGATILGNGSVALILDAQRLVQEAIRDGARNCRARAPTRPPALAPGAGCVADPAGASHQPAAQC